jgi:hypothetical protein
MLKYGQPSRLKKIHRENVLRRLPNAAMKIAQRLSAACSMGRWLQRRPDDHQNATAAHMQKIKGVKYGNGLFSINKDYLK